MVTTTLVNFLIFILIHRALSSTVLKFEGETAELPCGQGKTNKNLVWVGPQTNIVGSMHTNNSRFNLLTNGTLVIEDLQTTDAGKYICMASNFQGTPEIFEEYSLPFVYVRKNHMKSLWTALIIAGCFFIVAMTLYLLYEHKSGTFSSSLKPDDEEEYEKKQEIIERQLQKRSTGETNGGLPPDWSTQDGAPASQTIGSPLKNGQTEGSLPLAELGVPKGYVSNIYVSDSQL